MTWTVSGSGTKLATLRKLRASVLHPSNTEPAEVAAFARTKDYLIALVDAVPEFAPWAPSGTPKTAVVFNINANGHGGTCTSESFSFSYLDLE